MRCKAGIIKGIFLLSTVDAIGSGAVTKEIDYLTGSSDSGVNVSFGSLRAHLLRGEENTPRETFFKFLGSLGSDISHIFEVRTLIKRLHQPDFVNDFLTRGINKYAILGHEHHEIVTDRVASLGGSGDVERHITVVTIEVLHGMNWGDPGVFHNIVGTIGVKSGDIHLKPTGDAGDIAPNLPEGMDAQSLSFKFGAGGSVIKVAGHHYGETENELGDSVGVLAGCVLDTYPVGGSGCKVYIVISGTGTHDDLELTCGIEYLGIHLVGTDDERVGIGNRLKQLLAVSIFFKKFKRGTGILDHFTDTVDGNCRKRFFSSNEYFHNQ